MNLPIVLLLVAMVLVGVVVCLFFFCCSKQCYDCSPDANIDKPAADKLEDQLIEEHELVEMWKLALQHHRDAAAQSNQQIFSLASRIRNFCCCEKDMLHGDISAVLTC